VGRREQRVERLGNNRIHALVINKDLCEEALIHPAPNLNFCSLICDVNVLYEF